MKVIPSGAAHGAEIKGVDLSQPLDDATFDAVLDALHTHSVVVLRDQSISAQNHIDFSARIGAIDNDVYGHFAHPDHSEIVIISNVLDDDGNPIGVQDAGRFWHTDLAYTQTPSRASLLYSFEIPVTEDGTVLGDTLFANAAAAYDALPDDIKQRIHAKTSTFRHAYAYFKSGQGEQFKESAAKLHDVIHPLVVKHPFTGRKILFCNEAMTVCINELPEAESDALLGFLIEHVKKPEFVYRHKWRVGDLLIWDNFPTQHFVEHNFKLPLRRRMQRITVRGTIPTAPQAA
ncbi:MAG: TauD/TfdA family dioxygenase [Proteobacteria bacterium]|nr:TauD/TfdA family dioxygenase [Pseudomonadota bacterium]